MHSRDVLCYAVNLIFLFPHRTELKRGLQDNAYSGKKPFTVTRRLSEESDQSPPAAFNRLPVELQVEIFQSCVPYLNIIGGKGGPALLGQVCSAWRAVLLSTPSFWASFSLPTQVASPVNSMQLLQLWLERSRNHPLSLRMRDMGRATREVNVLPRTFLAAILPHIHRLRHLELQLPDLEFLSLFPTTATAFPSLRVLKLDMPGSWTPNESIRAGGLPFPWKSLSRLHLDVNYRHLPNLNECLEIWSQGANLTSIYIHADASQSIDEHRASMPVIKLPQLERLHLVFSVSLEEGRSLVGTPQSVLVSLMERVCLPRLAEFTVEWLPRGGGSPLSHWTSSDSTLSSYLCTLSHSLRTLRISYLPITTADLLGCLAQLPLLRTLDIRFSLAFGAEDPITDTFFLGCTPADATSSEESTKMPHLTSLSVRCSGDGYRTESIGRFVNRRMQNNSSHAALTTFGMSPTMMTSREIQDCVHDWRAAGLEVAVAS